jgi:hypothetical protein
LQIDGDSRIRVTGKVPMKSAKGDWLSRLGGSHQFFLLGDQPASRPVWSMGGLAAGAVPVTVRSSHGYAAQLPSDAQDPPREARPGDFFRN